MKAALPLIPVLPGLPILPAQPAPQVRAPIVQWIERKSPLLHAGPLGTPASVLSLNLAQGCLHGCGFCSARAYPHFPGDRTVLLYKNLAERLESELSSLRQLPRAVYLSPATDPFMPLLAVQEQTAVAVQVLAKHGVEAWLMTRGYIRPFVLEQLARVRHRVKVTVGITTLGRARQRSLEPLAAPPRLRLRTIAQLQQAGIPVHVEMAPLLPGLTDTQANLTELLEALAGVGVRQVTAGYLFLRSRISENLLPLLEAEGIKEKFLAEFEHGPVLSGDGISAARYLPKARRQRGFATLMSLAARLGMRVSICGLTNPDMVSRPAAPARPASLFE